MSDISGNDCNCAEAEANWQAAVDLAQQVATLTAERDAARAELAVAVDATIDELRRYRLRGRGDEFDRADAIEAIERAARGGKP